MLSGISWTEYFTGVAVAAGSYYLMIAIYYYSWEIGRLFSGKRLSPPVSKANEGKMEADMDEQESVSDTHWDEEETERAFVQAEELSERIRRTLYEVSEKDLDRRACLALLKTLIDQYGLFRDTPFRVAINNLIHTELEKYGSVPLSAVELDGLWEEDA